MKFPKKKVVFKSIDGVKVKIQKFASPVTEIKVIDEEKGIIEAYVSIFGNVDSYGEIVDKGAFSESIKNHFPRYPKGVRDHDWTQPIAKTLEIKEDERGLYVKAKLILEIEKARETYILMKEGVLTDFSFGYRVDEDAIDPETGFRHLKKLTIYEWSPVLVGANPKTTLVNVKSGEQGEEEEEDTEENEDTPTDPVDPLKPAEDEPKTPAPAPEATPSADEPKPVPTEQPATDPEKAIKAGRTISKATREKIEAAREASKAARSALKELHSTLETLLSIGDEDDGKTAQLEGVKKQGEGDDKHVIKLIVKEAKKADNALNRILFRAKAVTK